MHYMTGIYRKGKACEQALRPCGTNNKSYINENKYIYLA